MANTYSQILIHVVFTVKGRSNLIKKNGETIYIDTYQELSLQKDRSQLL
jgi:hypothetical protein